MTAVMNGTPGAIARAEEAITTAEAVARRAKQSPQHETTIAVSKAADVANRAVEVVVETAKQARAQQLMSIADATETIARRARGAARKAGRVAIRNVAPTVTTRALEAATAAEVAVTRAMQSL